MVWVGLSNTIMVVILWLGNLNFKKTFCSKFQNCWEEKNPQPSWNLYTKYLLKYSILGLQLSHEMTTNICVWYCYDSDIWMDYPKLISEKWNLTAKFNCLDSHYLMCHLHYVSLGHTYTVHVSGPYLRPTLCYNSNTRVRIGSWSLQLNSTFVK